MSFLSGTFRTLRQRNFRLFIIGQLISLIGTWAQRLGVGWLAWELTHSAFWVGAAAFAGLFPGVLAGPLAGSVVDSMSRFRLLKITQRLFLLQAAVLATLTITGHINIEWLLFLETLLALITAFDIPVRQALVVDLVGKEDLPNGIAINSTTVNITRMIGPALAGIIIVSFGIGEAFLFNAITYIAVLGSLAMIRLDEHAPSRGGQRRISHITDGLRYAWRTPRIRNWLLLFFLLALFGMPYGTIMPVVAEAGYGMGAAGLSWLVAASGLGATTGALLLASRKNTRGLTRMLFVGAVFFGLSLIVFGLIDSFLFAVLFVPFCGYAMMLQMAGINIALQTELAEEQRGRVMSLLSMAFQFAFPLGSLWMGWVADNYGVTTPFILGGGLTTLAALALGSLILHQRAQSTEARDA
ncbi:MAG: MFS transporter [Bacteroidota bacterium]|nr:MFS transporter [Bacteroidota bacterium]